MLILLSWCFRWVLLSHTVLVALAVRQVVHWVPTEELSILEPRVDWYYCYRDPG